MADAVDHGTWTVGMILQYTYNRIEWCDQYVVHCVDMTRRKVRQVCPVRPVPWKEHEATPLSGTNGGLVLYCYSTA